MTSDGGAGTHAGGPALSVSRWICSFPNLSQFSDKLRYVTWNQAFQLSVNDLKDMDVPGPAAVPMAKAIAQLRRELGAARASADPTTAVPIPLRDPTQFQFVAGDAIRADVGGQREARIGVDVQRPRTEAHVVEELQKALKQAQAQVKLFKKNAIAREVGPYILFNRLHHGNSDVFEGQRTRIEPRSNKKNSDDESGEQEGERVWAGDGLAALKVFRADEDRHRFVDEAEILQLLPAHRNIVELKEVLLDVPCLFEGGTSDVRCALVLELARHDLKHLIRETGPFPESEAKALFSQVIAAVLHCHEHGVIHRDVKPSQFLIGRDYNIKLTDFDLATHNVARSRSTRGSECYLAPELFVELKTTSHRLGSNFAYPKDNVLAATDVWGCGVVLLFILTSHAMMPTDDYTPVPASYQALLNLDFQTAWHGLGADELSSGAQDLLASLLHPIPSQRPHLPDVLMHPWLREAQDVSVVDILRTRINPDYNGDTDLDYLYEADDSPLLTLMACKEEHPFLFVLLPLMVLVIFLAFLAVAFTTEEATHPLVNFGATPEPPG